MNYLYRYSFGNQIEVSLHLKGDTHEGYEIILISDLCIMYNVLNSIQTLHFHLQRVSVFYKDVFKLVSFRCVNVGKR